MIAILIAIVSLQVNLDDLKPLNGGKSILLPGIAASEQVLNLEWSDAKLKECADAKNGDIGSLFLAAERKRTEGIRGVSLKADNLKGIIEGNDWIETLAFTALPKEGSTNEVPFTLEVAYGTEAGATESKKNVEDLHLPFEVEISCDKNKLTISGVFDITDKNTVLAAYMLIASVLQEDKDDETSSEAEEPIGEIIEISAERRAAVESTENRYFRRVFYTPVEQALAKESDKDRNDWACVLQTAEDSLYYLSGGILPSWREYLGRGAEEAYKKGCFYPVPLSFSYASLIKPDAKIQEAFSAAHELLGRDDQWNAASRMMFYSFFAIDKNAPERFTAEDKKRFKCRELKAYLKAADWTADELGAVYQLASFAAGDYLEEVISELKREGVTLDPWLEAMFSAEAAYRKAWNARGTGYANTVTEDGWRVYEEEIVKVLPLAGKAYNLRPDLPQSCALAMKTCYGEEGRQGLWLNRVYASRPSYLNALTQYLFGIRPRWGGSREKMARFCLSLAKRGEFETAVPVFAYERLVKDVFTSEGGISTEKGGYPNVDKFVREVRDAFEPYFDGYRKSEFYKTASFLERMHVAVALADIAWRLEKADELLYWSDEIKRLGMPVKETQFKDGYETYCGYLDTLKRLSGEKRRTFLVGVHALHSDGRNEDIDRMAELAREIGDYELAFKCALSRRGKSDLRGFLKNNGSQRTQNYEIKMNRIARDHMVFRFKLRGGARAGLTNFSCQLFALGAIGSGKSTTFTIQTRRGLITDKENPAWPYHEETCTFEVEFSGDVMRLTQCGRRIWERQLATRPSQFRNFWFTGFVGIEATVEKMELEVLDTHGFAIESEDIPMPTFAPPKPERPTTPKLGGVDVVACHVKDGFVGGYRMFNTINSKEDGKIYRKKLRESSSGVRLDVPEPRGGAAMMIARYDKLSRVNIPKDCALGTISFKCDDSSMMTPKEAIRLEINPENGIVSAVAVSNGKRWQSAAPLDLDAECGLIAFGYDYAHGVVVYQRIKDDEPWKEILVAQKCRYQGEKPMVLTVGCSSFSTGLKTMRDVEILDVYLYPKVLNLDELKGF